MSLQWISWHQPTDDWGPLSYPPNAAVLGVWCSGYTGDDITGDDIAILCALVIADSEDAAKAAVRVDWPEACDWRFCNKRPDTNLGDRFTFDDDWSRSRVEAYNAQEPPP